SMFRRVSTRPRGRRDAQPMTRGSDLSSRRLYLGVIKAQRPDATVLVPRLGDVQDTGGPRQEGAMKTIEEHRVSSIPGTRLVGHPGDGRPANGTYGCLCCGVVLGRLRKGRRFPDCPTHNCPTMWLWSEP